MTTPAQVRAHRRDLRQLTDMAAGDIQALFRQVSTPDGARDALLDTLPQLMDVYGSAASTLGADWYDDLRDAQGIRKRFTAIPAELPDRGRAEALARWAVTPLYQASPDFTTARIKATGGMQRIIANADRDSLRISAANDIQRAGWVRVGSGECSWCQQYLDGEIHYATGYDFDAHDFCGCSVTPVWDESDAEPPEAVIAEPEPLEPEPEFVEKLIGALRNGQLTPEQLRADSLKASALGQRNADEALKAFQAEQEAGIAARAAEREAVTVAGQVDERPGLSPDALRNALDPTKNRSASAIAKELEQTAEGRDTLTAIKSFTETRGGVANLRANIEKTINGSASEATAKKTRNFLDAMNNYPTEDVPTLYRGFAVKVEENTNAWWDNFEGQFEPGKTIELNASSFSSSEKKAAEFQGMIGGTKRAGSNYTQVRYVLDDQPHALPVQQLSKFKNEKEWITGGEFEVTEFERATPKRPYYVVHIRQRQTLRAQ